MELNKELYFDPRRGLFYIKARNNDHFDKLFKDYRAKNTLACPFMGTPDDGWVPVTLYRVPESNVARLNERIEKLQKAARKINCAAPELYFITESMEDHPQMAGVQLKVYQVAVIGETPRLNGWRFLAAIQHRRQTNIIHTPPWLSEVHIPERYRTAEAWCDHCHLKRNRRDTYLVVHDNGDIKQVGSNCLADFTGHSSPQALAAYAELIFSSREWVETMSEDEGDYAPGGAGVGIYLNLRHFLAVVAHMVGRTGFVPRGEDLRLPTADAALLAIVKPKSNPITPDEADYVMAGQALAWAKETIVQIPNKTNFEWNVLAILDEDRISYREVGIAAALIQMYRRAMEQAAMQGAESGSQYVGQLHTRHQFDRLKVVRVIPVDGFRGTTFVTKLRDGDGNVVVWFSSAERLVENAVYAGAARIEAHEPYKGVNQTRISRAKLTMVEPPPLEAWAGNEYDMAEFIDRNLKSGQTWTVGGSTIRRDGEWDFYLDEENRQDIDAIVGYLLQVKEAL